MKKKLLSLLLFFFYILTSSGQIAKKETTQPQAGTVNWTADPFDDKVFIENLGQFTDGIKNDTALFAAQMGKTNAYFTKNGVVFRYLEEESVQSGKDPDADGPPKRTYHTVSLEWEGSNPDVTIESLEEQNDYYTYPLGSDKTIKANIFKKITYHNLYPGIDLVYSFPKDGKNEKKYGIKYALIIHPGADLTQVKLKYSGVSASRTDDKGNVIWSTGELGEITDHAPISYNKDEPENTISVSYVIHDDEESFSINSVYDKNKILIIDPWISDPLFSTYDNAYSLDYDYAGNVYVYGGWGYQLVKLNSVGAKQWTFNASTLTSSTTGYGDFAVDRISQESYISEGWNSSGGGARCEKVNTNGLLMATDPGNTNMNEIWGVRWDPCNRDILGTGGGTCCPYQACIIDTNMVSNTLANICAPAVVANGYHDMWCIAVDPAAGYLYTATMQSLSYAGVLNNYLIKCPVPGLVPVSYQVPDLFNLDEWSTFYYVSGSVGTNGMNGAAVSPNWLYMYNGETLKQINKNSGAINATTTVSITPYTWGGLDVDYCDDIYAGVSTSVEVFNASLNLTGTLPLTNTVYDVRLGAIGTLYACGKGFVSSISILQPNIYISKTRTNAACSCTGTASVQPVLCGVPYVGPATYQWSTGQTTSSITGLCPGTDTISISIGCNLKIKDTVLIKNSAGPLNITTTQVNATCGLCNGIIVITPKSGSPPYTYSWNPGGQTTDTVTGLCAGTYTIIVKDSNGCIATDSITITQTPALVATATVIADVKCNGGKSGSAKVTASGGTSPYTYSWNPGGQTNANATGLSAGNYTVTVKDSNGCTATATVTITQPPVLIASASVVTNVSCHGGNNGSAVATVSGGVSPYTYAWSPAGGSNATGTGLSANTPYTVTVTDANGCTASASITLTQPAGMTLTMGAPTYPLCNGGTGTASITVTGGTPNYTYAWNPSGQTTANATGLTSAIYTVTVTDAQGCSLSDSVDITQPSAISIITGLTPASCNLPNGGASATVSGGVGPYAYVWTPIGQTTAAATGISAGTYTVTVTDHNHCTASAPVTITQPSAVVASINGVTPDLCNGGHEGTATATATGGTSPYNYLWSPGGNTNAAGTGLGAGTYTMTITDASGCSSTASATVTQPPALVVNVSGPFTLCTGAKGLLTASVSGGTAPYIYSWTGLNNATSDTVSITPVISQTYTVNITDANGCTTQGYFTVNLGPALSISLAKNVSICKGTSTTLCVTPFGGTGGNVYNWQPGNFTTPCITISPTSTTIYTVSVSDNCGAIATASSIVVVGSPPDVGFSADLYQGCAPLCIQFRDASTFFQGGAKHFIWQFGNGDTLQSQNPIYCYKDSGTFSVTLTVSSDSGCSATLNKINLIRVYQHPTAAFSISPQPATILAPTIQFTDKSFGPADIEYWRWNFGDESDTISKLQNPEHTYRDTGTYCANLIIMDAHGCTDTTTNCLVIEPAFNLYIPSAFSPNGDGINDVFQPIGQYIQSFDMYIFDRWGMELYHTTDINKGWNGTVNGGSTIAQEDTYIYKITVTDSQGNQHSYVGNVTLIK